MGQRREEFVFFLVGVLQCFFHSPPLGHIVKNHHRAGNVSSGISDWSRAVFNASFRSVSSNQGGVIGQADDNSFAQNFVHRIFRRLAGFFIDDVENFFQRLAGRLVGFPPGHHFGDRIEKSDFALSIGRDHCVADAGERDLIPFALLPQFLFRPFALGDISKAPDPADVPLFDGLDLCKSLEHSTIGQLQQVKTFRRRRSINLFDSGTKWLGFLKL